MALYLTLSLYIQIVSFNYNLMEIGKLFTKVPNNSYIYIASKDLYIASKDLYMASGYENSPTESAK